MKDTLHTAGFILLFLFALAFFGSSCSAGAGDTVGSYARSDVDAHISGVIDGNEIEVILHSRPNAKEDEVSVSVHFLVPDSLNGLAVSLLANGECVARLGDTETDIAGLVGLVEPFSPVFIFGEIYSREKTSNGGELVRICDENCDITYVFGADKGLPSRVFGQYKGKSIDLSIEEYAN